VCLIPEVPFELDRLLDHVAKIVDKRGHVVICTAEGAGQVRCKAFLPRRQPLTKAFGPAMRGDAAVNAQLHWLPPHCPAYVSARRPLPHLCTVSPACAQVVLIIPRSHTGMLRLER